MSGAMDDLVLDTKAMADTAVSMLDGDEGTFWEHKTRRERNFADVESGLPDIKMSPGPDDRPDLATKLLSHLGTWNPVPHRITDNDTVWLLDNTAYRTADNEWQAEFVAAEFDKSTGAEVSKVGAEVAEKIGIGKGSAQETIIRDRLIPFVQAVLPARVVKVDFAKQVELKLGPSGRNGISSDIRALPEFGNGEVVPSQADVPQQTNGILEMNTVYAEPEGWGLISDIDDTIKITQTSDPIGILRSTFVSQPTPVKGMPELYQFIQRIISPSAPFFYLSASPYNLYQFLRGFRNQYYPQGTVILRDANWMNLSGLLSNLTLGTQAYKVDRMKKINSWLPKRMMICIGDSTQSDPEAYGQIYRTYPGWVKLILIRKVIDIAAVGIQEKNEPQRFETAFKGVSRHAWHVFEEPEECYQIIKDVVSRYDS